MTVELAMVVFSEGRRGGQLAGEHTAGERDAGENADFALEGLLKKESGGALTKTVENDLDGLDVWILDGFQRLFDAFDTNAVVADFARFHE